DVCSTPPRACGQEMRNWFAALVISSGPGGGTKNRIPETPPKPTSPTNVAPPVNLLMRYKRDSVGLPMAAKSDPSGANASPPTAPPTAENVIPRLPTNVVSP